jgi:MFS family permease
LSCFMAISLTIGYNSCYGVFQEYYLSPSQSLLQPAPASMQTPPTALLAFVGTLGAGLTWAGSIFVNPLISRIDYMAVIPSTAGFLTSQQPNSRRLWHRLLRTLTSRHITLTGVALMAVGFLSASFSHTVEALLFTQGLLYGLGSSMLYFPLLGPAPEYFNAHRGTALGFILAGGGVGGLVLSPVLRALLSSVGGPWTLRILAALYVLIGTPEAWNVSPSLFPAVTPESPRVSSEHNDTIPLGGLERTGSRPQQALMPRRRTHIPLKLAMTPIFLLSSGAAFTQSAGAQIPLTFIPSYTVALGFSSARGATLLAVANAVNAAARVASGYAGDRLGRQNALVVSAFISFAAVLGLWLGSIVVTSTANQVSKMDQAQSSASKLWLAFVIVYSSAAGGYYALFPASVADVFGIRSYAAVNGFIYFLRGLGAMVGSPVGGALLRAGGPDAVRSYTSAVIWDASLWVACVICLFGVRWTDALRRGWMWRA